MVWCGAAEGHSARRHRRDARAPNQRNVGNDAPVHHLSALRRRRSRSPPMSVGPSPEGASPRSRQSAGTGRAPPTERPLATPPRGPGVFWDQLVVERGGNSQRLSVNRCPHDPRRRGARHQPPGGRRPQRPTEWSARHLLVPHIAVVLNSPSALPDSSTARAPSPLRASPCHCHPISGHAENAHCWSASAPPTKPFAMTRRPLTAENVLVPGRVVGTLYAIAARWPTTSQLAVPYTGRRRLTGGQHRSGPSRESSTTRTRSWPARCTRGRKGPTPAFRLFPPEWDGPPGTGPCRRHPR
ncbi:hypothetical protein SATRM34S_04836 [Streptomyces atroolivaceus]